MKKILFIILLFTTPVFADEIRVIDSNTFEVVTENVSTKSFDSLESEISDIRLHKDRMQREEEQYAAQVVEDEEKIAAIEKQYSDAKQKAIDTGIINGVKTEDLEIIAPSNDGVNWNKNP